VRSPFRPAENFGRTKELVGMAEHLDLRPCRAAPPCAEDASLGEKVALLSRAASYGPALSDVRRIETHMSWIFAWNACSPESFG